MAGNFVTPWLHALSERFGPPHDLFAGMPADLGAREEFQQSGLYLWRQAVSPTVTTNLAQQISPIMTDIYKVKWSHKPTEMSTYASFQATSSARCSCKYNYTGASKQVLYHKGGISTLQPRSVTTFLDTAFRAFEEWGEGVYPMIKQPCDSAEKHKPRDFNLLVVNEYNFESKPDSYIPWHDDKMDQSIRNDEDAILTPVISMSLGDAAVFAVMPNREAPQFFY